MAGAEDSLAAKRNPPESLGAILGIILFYPACVVCAFRLCYLRGLCVICHLERHDNSKVILHV